MKKNINEIKKLAQAAISKNTCMAGRDAKKINEIRGNGTVYTMDEVGVYFMDDIPMGSTVPLTDDDGNIIRKAVGVCHLVEFPDNFFSPGANFNRFLEKMVPYYVEEEDMDLPEEDAYTEAIERLSADIKEGGGMKVRVDNGTKRNGQPFNKLSILD